MVTPILPTRLPDLYIGELSVRRVVAMGWYWCLVVLSVFSFEMISVHADSNWRELGRWDFPMKIKAATHLSLRVVRDNQGTAYLRGDLKDDRRQGIADQDLVLILPDGQMRKVQTNQNGIFSIPAAGLPQQGSYRISYVGNARWISSEIKRFLHLGRVDLQIEVNSPPILPANTKHFAMEIALYHAGQSLPDLPITLWLSDLSGATSTIHHTQDLTSKSKKIINKGKAIALITLYTDKKGQASFEWQGKPLVGPAQLEFMIQFAGNANFLPQHLHRPLAISAPDVPPAHGHREHWLFWGVAIFMGAFGLAFLVLYLIKRYKNPDMLIEQSEWISTQPKPEDLRVGPSIIQAPASDLGIGGVVRDASNDKPLSGISISVKSANSTSDTEMIQVVSDGYGRFLLEYHSAVKVEISFEHLHYQSKHLFLSLPHIGTGRFLTIQIHSYRYLIFEVFARIMQSYPSDLSIDLHRQTAREILALLDPSIAQNLQPLVKVYEKTYYGAVVPVAEDYNEILRFLDNHN
jgi:hypothetical protein